MHDRRFEALIRNSVRASARIDIIHLRPVVVSTGLQPRCVAVLLHQEDVVAILAKGCVTTASKDKCVVARAAPHARAGIAVPGIVVASPADEIIVTSTADQAICPCATKQHVVAVPTVDRVVAITAVQPVPTGRARQIVAEPAANDDVVAAGDGVGLSGNPDITAAAHLRIRMQDRNVGFMPPSLPLPIAFRSLFTPIAPADRRVALREIQEILACSIAFSSLYVTDLG